VGILAKIFESHATSYKYFFFLSLINRLESAFDKVLDPVDDIAKPIPLSELAIDMVLLAWYPSHFCKLSLGGIDQFGSIVDSIEWFKARPHLRLPERRGHALLAPCSASSTILTRLSATC
jgi:hypothetical protein